MFETTSPEVEFQLNLIIGGNGVFFLKPECSGSIYVKHWGVQNLLVLCALKNLSNNI